MPLLTLDIKNQFSFILLYGTLRNKYNSIVEFGSKDNKHNERSLVELEGFLEQLKELDPAAFQDCENIYNEVLNPK